MKYINLLVQILKLKSLQLGGVGWANGVIWKSKSKREAGDFFSFNIM